MVCCLLMPRLRANNSVLFFDSVILFSLELKKKEEERCVYQIKVKENKIDTPSGHSKCFEETIIKGRVCISHEVEKKETMKMDLEKA